MISTRTIATTSLLLLTMPTLLPSALALDAWGLANDGFAAAEETRDAAAGGCRTSYSDWMNRGHLSIAKRGTYDAEAQAINGCGGNNCDDAVEGYFHNGAGSWFYFNIHETRTYQGCSFTCVVEWSRDSYRGKVEVEGYMYIDMYENLASVRCGTEGTSTYLFKGDFIWTADGNVEPDLPPVQTGDVLGLNI